MSAIYRYFLIFIACASILFGIQIPSFVDQYEKRLDAHFIEVKNNLRGYQEIADRYHNGSMEALISKHEDSEDRTFREEAKPIRNMYDRYLRFKEQKSALDTNLAGKLAVIAANRDRELVDETYANYSYTVPLDKAAVFAGSLSAAVALLVIELLAATILWLFRLIFHPGVRTGRRWGI
jgi:hypothetical protein